MDSKFNRVYVPFGHGSERPPNREGIFIFLGL